MVGRQQNKRIMNEIPHKNSLTSTAYLLNNLD